MTIERAWRQHRERRLPDASRLREIDGIDLVTLDTYTAGCLSAFVDRKGKLDKARIAVLGVCYRDLRYVLPKLRGASRKYFAELEQLAGVALLTIAKTERLR